MRVLLDIELPLEPFNTYVKSGQAAAKMQKVLDSIKPEAAYFTARNGCRGGTLVVNIDHPSQIPALAEPWFLTFNANVRFHVAMVAEDLVKADLGAIGKQW